MKTGSSIWPMVAIVTFEFFLFAPAQADYFSPSTFWECMLEKMPEADNDRTASEMHRECEKEFPKTEEYETDAWRIYGPANHEECMSDYIAQTRSVYARTMLRQACYCLFSKSKVP
jgi:hypothetical protein